VARFNSRTPELRSFLSQPLLRPDWVSESANTLPTISVVVPSLNQGEFLERTILSILNQSYPNTELIVIDGGSKDDSLDIIRKYAPHISFWVSEADRGQTHALNKGFSHASGEILGWQNADDMYMPGVFHLIGRIFNENPAISVCYGDWYSINEHDEIMDITYALPPRKPRFPYENMNSYNQAMFWRREVHERFGEFDEKLSRLMDNDMILRFLLREGVEGFQQVERFLGAFRRHSTQKTGESVDAMHEQEELYLERKLSFQPRSSIAGKLFRFEYRLFQLLNGLKRGGLPYVVRKFRQGYIQKKGLL